MELYGVWRHRPADLAIGGGPLSAAWGFTSSLLFRRLLSLCAPTIELQPAEGGCLRVTERSHLGALSRCIPLDGTWCALAQAWGLPVETRASLVPGTGALRIESRCGGGLLVETLRLLPRGELQQALEFTPGGAGGGGAAEAVVRTWDWVGAGAAPAPRRAGLEEAPPPPPPPPPLTLPLPAPPPPPLAATTGGASDPHWEPPDFTGSWRISNAHSDSLEPILKLMGVPWLAVKVAVAVDVTTIIAHDVGAGTVATVDKTAIGILSTNDMLADGVAVAKVGADKRVARVTCALSPLPPPGHPFRALPAAVARAQQGGGAGGGEPPPQLSLFGCMRIVTELPDGIGASDNVWALYGAEGGAVGAVIAAALVFRKPGPGGAQTVAVAHRVMVRAAGSATPLPSPAWARRSPAASPAATPAATPAPSPTAPAIAAAPATPPSARPRALPPPALAGRGGGGGEDPLFVCLAGAWAASASGASGACPLAAAAARAALECIEACGGAALAAALRSLLPAPSPPTSSRGSPGFRAAPPPPPAPPPLLQLEHSPSALRLWAGWAGASAAPGGLEVRLGAGWHAAPLPSGGDSWVVARAEAVEGGGGQGSEWLGHELGELPAALQAGANGAALTLEQVPGGQDPLPHFSAAPFSPANYACASVELLVLLRVFAGAGEAEEAATAAAAAEAAAAGSGEGGKAPPHLRLRLQADLGGASTGSAPPPAQLLVSAEVVEARGGRGAHDAVLPLASECARCGGAPAAAAARVKAERARVRHVRALLLERRAAADGKRKAVLLQLLREAGAAL